MDSEPADEAVGDVISVPEAAHIRRDSHESYETTLQDETDSDSELEATELRRLSREIHSTLQPISHILSPGKPMIHWYDPIKKLWRHQIRISVPHDDCRDHLGKSAWSAKTTIGGESLRNYYCFMFSDGAPR